MSVPYPPRAMFYHYPLPWHPHNLALSEQQRATVRHPPTKRDGAKEGILLILRPACALATTSSGEGVSNLKAGAAPLAPPLAPPPPLVGSAAGAFFFVAA